MAGPRSSASWLGLSGVAGVWAGVAALSGKRGGADLPELLPLAGVRFGVDALSGWFLLLVGAVTSVVGIYTIGYAGSDGHGAGSRSRMATLPLFTGSMLLVPAAGERADVPAGAGS